MSRFDEITVGQVAVLHKHVSQQDMDAFARLSGDQNPLHVDPEFSADTAFRRPIVYGMLVASYVFHLIGVELPGPGALCTQQSFRWPAPVYVGDDLEIRLTIVHKSQGTRTVKVAMSVVNQHGVVVMEGEGVVMVVDSNPQVSHSVFGSIGHQDAAAI
ncbi:MAG: MaoC family dehydratase [Acidobacteria bacterium]|nr:MaoC family dehydratase [Acidobacteriota bacterium]